MQWPRPPYITFCVMTCKDHYPRIVLCTGTHHSLHTTICFHMWISGQATDYMKIVRAAPDKHQNPWNPKGALPTPHLPSEEGWICEPLLACHSAPKPRSAFSSAKKGLFGHFHWLLGSFSGGIQNGISLTSRCTFGVSGLCSRSGRLQGWKPDCNRTYPLTRDYYETNSLRIIVWKEGRFQEFRMQFVISAKYLFEIFQQMTFLSEGQLLISLDKMSSLKLPFSIFPGFATGWFPKGWFWLDPKKPERGYKKGNDGIKKERGKKHDKMSEYVGDSHNRLRTRCWAFLGHIPRMRLFCYSWKLPAYSGAFLLAVDNFSFCTYSWSFFAYSFSFLLTVGAFLLTMGKCV